MSPLAALRRILDLRTWVRANVAADGVDLRRDYRRVLLDDAAGRRVLADLLQKTHLWETTFEIGDAGASAFREGRRSIGLEILDLFDEAPLLPTLETEPPSEPTRTQED